MADHPSCQILVVSRIELVSAQPEIMSESVKELGVFEDDGAVGGCTAGEAREASVDVGGGGDFNVSDGKTECSENFPDCHAIADRLHSLRSADTTYFLILKASEDIGQHCRGPNGIIVGKDNDICGGVLDTMGHLEPFVGVGNGEDTDTIWVDGVCEFLERAKHFLFCDDEDFLGFSC